MAVPTKPFPLRLAVPLALALLLALAFVADFLVSPTTTPAVATYSKTVTNFSPGVQVKGNSAKRVGILNATYADLPAPRWDWEEMPAAPVPRLDGASVQIGDLLYVVAGYQSLDHVRTLSSLTHSLRAEFLPRCFPTFFFFVSLSACWPT
jgi:hypothetical protein